MPKKGYIHVYTGNGKGKTTAALGLALRAAGAGMRVYIAQFIKGMHYHELDALEKFSGQISIEQFGRDCFIERDPEPEDIKAAEQGLEMVSGIIAKGKHELVILDEINIALYYKLIKTESILKLMKDKPAHIELILTGRYAPPEIIEMADLVTNMEEVKHYYTRGIEARPGIEF